jgi:glycosyltransferase involved in cell wall biosynthesis
LVFAARHQLAHSHVETLLAPSEGLAAALRQVAPDRPVVAVPLGIDTGRFRRKAPPAWPPARPEIVVLGRLDPVKGHAVLCRMVAALLKTWEATLPRPRLHIVGEPANLSVAHITAQAAAAGLVVGDDVVMTGRRVEDIGALLSGAAVGVVPSLGSEMICRVAEEFLVCGTPVVVSGVGSLEETLAFPGAGVSWKGMTNAGAVGCLKEWVVRSIGEEEADKKRRAETAADIFGLERMGNALGALLG